MNIVYSLVMFAEEHFNFISQSVEATLVVRHDWPIKLKLVKCSWQTSKFYLSMIFICYSDGNSGNLAINDCF